MALSMAQRQVLEEWMSSKGITRCPAGEPDLTESGGVVEIPCDNCGYLVLFDAATVGIRGSWAQGRNL